MKIKQVKNNPTNLKIVVIGVGKTENAVVEHLSHTDLTDKVRLAVIDIDAKNGANRPPITVTSDHFMLKYSYRKYLLRW